VNFAQSIVSGFTNYANFRGRASRSEFWFWVLFSWIATAVVTRFGIGWLTSIASLVLVLPSLAVGVRRLHDTGSSAFTLLLGLIPLAGPVILLVKMLQSSTPGQNQYGKDPLEISPFSYHQSQQHLAEMGQQEKKLPQSASGKVRHPRGGRGVYAIRVVHPDTGKRAFYIGESTNIRQRWATHKADLLSRQHHSKFLQRDINQGAFCDFFVLHTVPKDLGYEQAKTEMQRVEQFYWEFGNHNNLLLLNDNPFKVDKKVGSSNNHAGAKVSLWDYQASDTANEILNSRLVYDCPPNAPLKVKRAAVKQYVENTRKQFGGLAFADVDETKAYSNT